MCVPAHSLLRSELTPTLTEAYALLHFLYHTVNNRLLGLDWNQQTLSVKQSISHYQSPEPSIPFKVCLDENKISNRLATMFLGNVL